MIIEKIAIDLGSTNVLVYSNDNKKTIKESSIVNIKKDKIKIIKNGLITNLDIATLIIEDMIKKLNIKQIIYRPQIFLSIPSDLTLVEKNTFKELIENVGCNKINMYDEILLSAIGSGVDINNIITFIINIGGEVTNIGIISKGKIINQKKINIGGEHLNEILIKFLKEKYNIVISNELAEEIKINNIDIYNPKNININIKGIELTTSLPITKSINVKELKNIYDNILEQWIENIKLLIENTPIDMAVKLIDRGLIITGGSSLLKGLRETLEDKIKIPVYKTIDPLNDTLEGLKIIMNNKKNRRL